MGAILLGASLLGASLLGASLLGASLLGASLLGASLLGASLFGTARSGATLLGAAVTWAPDSRAITAFFAVVLLLIKDFFSTDMVLSPFLNFRKSAANHQSPAACLHFLHEACQRRNTAATTPPPFVSITCAQADRTRLGCASTLG